MVEEVIKGTNYIKAVIIVMCGIMRNNYALKPTPKMKTTNKTRRKSTKIIGKLQMKVSDDSMATS